MLRLTYMEMDYGHAVAIAGHRGPERVGVTVRTRRRRGVLPVRRRRVAIAALRRWAVSSTRPRGRLSMIRRRRA